MPCLYSKDLSVAAFLNILEKHPFPAQALLIAFTPAQPFFGPFQYDRNFLELTDQGRVFSPEGELKWRRLGELMRVVYLGNSTPPEGLIDHSTELKDLKPEPHEFILWGRRVDEQDEWIEQQIPNRFNYPVATSNYENGRVSLVVENWIDEFGFNQFSRYCSIKEITEWGDKEVQLEEKKVSGQDEVVQEIGEKNFYRLKQVEIENFQCIKKTAIYDLPDNARWIFLTGDNGSGKTAFLQALTIGVCGMDNANKLLKENKKCSIKVGVLEKTKEKIKEIFWIQNMNAWKTVARPDYFCAYGPSHLEIVSEEVIKEDIDPETSLLDQRGNLRNIQRLIKDQKLSEDSDPKIEKRRKNILALFEKMFSPNISKIKLEEHKLFFYEKGFKATLDTLASGHKSIIAMVGDILIRLFEMQPQETDPSNLAGIVVIDEIDVHLHPLLQRELPKLLSEALPRVQFICSTHSSLPLLGGPKDDSMFFVVERDEERGTTVRKSDVDVRRLHPNAVLTSPLFDLEKLFSEALGDNFKDLDAEDDYKDIIYRKKLYKDIMEDIENGDPIPDEWFEDLK